jgi:hypothetical protein
MRPYVSSRNVSRTLTVLFAASAAVMTGCFIAELKDGITAVAPWYGGIAAFGGICAIVSGMNNAAEVIAEKCSRPNTSEQSKPPANPAPR